MGEEIYPYTCEHCGSMARRVWNLPVRKMWTICDTCVVDELMETRIEDVDNDLTDITGQQLDFLINQREQKRRAR